MQVAKRFIFFANGNYYERQMYGNTYLHRILDSVDSMFRTSIRSVTPMKMELSQVINFAIYEYASLHSI